MLLFLDVISPIPEFFIIEDNKVIFKRKILEYESDRLSDNLFETYIEIHKNLKLSENLEKIVMITGPGSYTSLRVGAAFLSGLIISKKLKLCSITIGDFYKFNNYVKSGIFITSSKNQKFFCSINNKKEIEYIKVDENNFILPKNINKIYYNVKRIKLKNNNIKQYKFSFIDQVLDNFQNLKFTKNKIIKPIYISNNKLLN